MYNYQMNGRITYLEHESTVLNGNPLGDPHIRTFPVYLPPDYSPDGPAYPVIYALAGFTGTGQNMPNFAVWEETVPEQIDQLIASGEAPPAIVVMPDCFTSLGGSQYLNSPLLGQYEDYLVNELIPFIDDELNTLPKRGLTGLSSGGYGAVTLGMKHPGTFNAVACHSGDMYFTYGYMRDFPKAIDAINRAGSVPKFLQQFEDAQIKGPHIMALNVIAMAAAYAPDDAKDIPLPFKLPSGELIPEVWKRWLALDPVNMIADHIDALRSLDLLFIDAGERDEFALNLGARIFVDRLKSLAIPHTYEEHSAGHFGIKYRYKVSLKLLAETLSGK